MPCVETAVVSFLFDAVGDYDAAIPSWNTEMLEPLHAVYRRSAILAYLESHTSLSLRPMIRSINTRYVPVAELRQFDPDLTTFTNINKVEDLDRINAPMEEKRETGQDLESKSGL
jgi:molybdopterin-guanine dinucleotide biosynthesis protein A